MGGIQTATPTESVQWETGPPKASEINKNAKATKLNDDINIITKMLEQIKETTAATFRNENREELQVALAKLIVKRWE